MICPNCGKENEEGVKFCIDCGTPLVPVSAETVDHIPEEVQIETQPAETEFHEEKTPADQPVFIAPAPAEKVPEEKAQPTVQVQPVTDSRSLLTTAQYFFLTVLFSIPVIGLIFMFVWGCGRPSNISLKRYSLAMLTFRLVACFLSLLGTIVTLLGISGIIPGFSINLPFIG